MWYGARRSSEWTESQRKRLAKPWHSPHSSVFFFHRASNASFNITVVPKKTAAFNDLPATISYDYKHWVDAEEGGDEVVKRVGFSTTNGAMNIISEAEFLKATATFVVEWTIFGLMGSLTIILPMLAWVSITTQNNILVEELVSKLPKKK
jgi:hypothetical protein